MTALLSGDGRRAVAARIVEAYDEVAAGGGPLLISLEAPSGWGKTRIIQDVYERLAADRQHDTGRYWPSTLVDGAAERGDILRERKTVAPAHIEREPGSVPAFFWWGISAFERSGVPSVALAHDLRQFDGHLPFLVARCKQLSRLRERGSANAREIAAIALEEAGDELTSAVLDLAGLGLPGVGFVWRIGSWTAGRISGARRERRLIAEGSTIHDDLSRIASDAYETVQSISRRGLPLVVVVEDLQYADATLVELLARLLDTGKPILVLSTSWPGAFETSPMSSRLHASSARVVRLSTVSPSPAGWPPLAPLSADDLAAIVREYYPRATERTIAALTRRSDSPLELRLICTLPSIARQSVDGALDADPAVIEALPPSLDGVYEQMWMQLPDAVRESLAFALCGIPTDVDPGAGNGDDRWDASLLARVARALFPDADGLVEAIDTAQTGYAWAELVDAALRAFPDEANRRIVEERRPEFYSMIDVERIRRELTRVIGDELEDPALPDAVRQHRASLLLALSAEGFGVDEGALAAAADVQTELLEAVDEAARVIEILDQVSAPDPERPPARALRPLSAGLTPMSPELRVRRALALASSGRFRAATDELDEVISDIGALRGDEDPLVLDARIERAWISLRAPRSDESAADLGALRRTIERVFGTSDPRVLRLMGMQAVTASIDGRDGLPAVVTDEAGHRVRSLVARFGVTDPELVAYLRLMAEEARLSGFPETAAGFLDTQARDLATAVGDKHPEVMRLRIDGAACLVEAGDPRTALREAGAVRAAFIDAGGPRSDDAIKALTVMIAAESALGRSVQDAHDVARRLSDEASSDPARPSILRLRIALRLSDLAAEEDPGDDDIRDLFELLDAAGPVLGEADIDVEALRHALAETLLLAGHPESARALAEVGSHLCARHRSTPRAWRRVLLLGRCYEILGQAAEAVTAYVFVAEAAEQALDLARRAGIDHAEAETTAQRAHARITLVQRLSPTGWYPTADIDVRTTDADGQGRKPAWLDGDFFADEAQMLVLAQHLHGRSLIHGPADEVALDLLRALRRFHFTRGEHEPALILTRRLLTLVPLPLYGRLSGASEVDEGERRLLAAAAVESATSIDRPDEAIAVIDAVLDHADSADGTAMLLRDKATLLAEAGDIEAALESLALARDHSEGIEHVLVVESALDLLEDHGRFTVAIDLARSELGSPHTDAPQLLLGRIARLLHAEGRIDEALATLTNAIDDPSLAEHRAGLRSTRARLREDAGDDEGAVDDLHAVLRTNADDGFAKVALVAPLMRLARRDEASEHFLDAVAASRRAGLEIIDFTFRERVIAMVIAFGEPGDAIALAEEYLLHLEEADLGWIESTLRSNGEALLASALDRSE